MDCDILERCWAKSGDFPDFEELLAQHGRPALEQDDWREVASFLYVKAQRALVEGSEETMSMHTRPQYESFCSRGLCESPPAWRPKFPRGTVEGEMIHAMSPGSTPNRTCSVLSPLDITSSTPPDSAQRPSFGRRPLAPVMPFVMQADVPTLLDISPMKASNLQEAHLGPEALPTRHVLNSSLHSSDSNTCKENLPMEGEKLQMWSPLASPPRHSPQEGSLTAPVADSGAPYSQSLTRYDSSVSLHPQTVGGVRYTGQAGTAAAQALSKAVEERTVGYFPRASTSSSVNPAKSGLMSVAAPSRLGTGSTPVPPRSDTSPRQFSPLQMLPSRSSRPPPQVSQAQTSHSTVSGVGAMAGVPGAVRSATLIPTSSGSLRTSTTSFAGAQCSGSLCVTLGGNNASGQYQCSSQPMVIRQPQDRRMVVSPRY